MFSKWLPMGATILKQTLEPKIIKLNLFRKSMHTSDKGDLCFLCIYSIYGVILWILYFYKALVEKKINIQCELVTSQPHWFSGSHLDLSLFSNFNNFQIYGPICMKFAPNSLVLETLNFDYGLTCSDPFPLRIWSSAKPRPMINVISQSLGLDLASINVYAKVYQNTCIPNGLRVTEIFHFLSGDKIFTNCPGTKSSQTFRWQNQNVW